MHNFLFSSSDFEIVDGVLILEVFSESSNSGTSGGAISYKVRIEHTPGAWGPPPGVACLRSTCAPPIGWTFSCSCPPAAKSLADRNGPEMCKHIGACLIVHFYTPPKASEDGDDEDDNTEDDDDDNDEDDDDEDDFRSLGGKAWRLGGYAAVWAV